MLSRVNQIDEKIIDNNGISHLTDKLKNITVLSLHSNRSNQSTSLMFVMHFRTSRFRGIDIVCLSTLRWFFILFFSRDSLATFRIEYRSGERETRKENTAEVVRLFTCLSAREKRVTYLQCLFLLILYFFSVSRTAHEHDRYEWSGSCWGEHGPEWW